MRGAIKNMKYRETNRAGDVETPTAIRGGTPFNTAKYESRSEVGAKWPQSSGPGMTRKGKEKGGLRAVRI